MNQTLRNSIIYGIISLSIIGSFCAIYLFGQNVPHWDDHAVRVFVDRFTWSKIGDLINFHNEHRIATTRMAALKVNWLFGELNFKHLMIWGQLGLVALMAWYIFLSHKFDLNKWLLIPLALFIFNFSTYENSLWGMAAMQNHWIFFWSLSSLLFLTFESKQVVAKDKHTFFDWLKSNYWFIAAVFSSIIALISSGNGLLVGPIGLAVLFFLGKRKLGLYWLLIHAVLIAFYFIGFESSQSSGRPHIEDFFLNLFTLQGSFLAPFFNLSISVKAFTLLGLLNLLFTFWVFVKLFFGKGDSKKLVSFLALQAFFMGTLVLVAMGRSDVDRVVLLSSKYKIYSFLILGTNLLFLGIQNEKWFKAIMALSGLLFINAQVSNYSALKGMSADRQADLYNLKVLYGDAATNTAYVAPELAFETYLNSDKSVLDSEKIDSIALGKEYVLFFEDSFKSAAPQGYIWLKTSDYTHLIPFHNGMARLDLLNFKTEIYEVFYLETGESETVLYNTNKTLKIEGVNHTEAPKNW